MKQFTTATSPNHPLLFEEDKFKQWAVDHQGSSLVICWFRRDLRLHDQTALWHALQSGLSVLPLFIFDHNILKELPADDARVHFIRDAVSEMHQELKAFGSGFFTAYGEPLAVFEQLFERLKADQIKLEAIYVNEDYEPVAIERDEKVASFFKKRNEDFVFHAFKDQVLTHKSDVLKDDGLPYTVFTPYSKKWALMMEKHPDWWKVRDTKPLLKNLLRWNAPEDILPLQVMGFEASSISFPPKEVRQELLKAYAEKRDFPGVPGTSRLGVHLRFGTISIRELAQLGKAQSAVFLNELIWRDFYHMILWHFPHIAQGKAFRKEYDAIQWRNNEQEFEAWCSGRTGYPIVDAGMRELNATGFMHNRVRMIVASFLTKHLLIDWRWGESYFAQKLLDFDFAANNGGWQWAAGSGCDAAPYFRVFNPTLQTQKFDKDLTYIKKWVPDLNELSYPKPIVVHEFARKRCLETYSVALKK
jgi:deoxyribodipyrimidine photo-lyase